MNDYRSLLNALMMQQRQRYADGGMVDATALQSGGMAPEVMAYSAMPTQAVMPQASPNTFSGMARGLGSMYGQAQPQAPTPTQPGFPSQPFNKPPMSPPPVPTQPGFMPPQGGMFGQGFPQNFNPQGSPMGGLNMFGQGQGMSPQYRQQLQSWRDTRPEYENGMDRDAFRQQMQTWRGQRPEFGAMQPSAPYAPDLNLPNGFGRPPIQQQNTPVNYFNDVVNTTTPDGLAASGTAYKQYDPAANSAYLQSVGLSGSSVNNGNSLNPNLGAAGLISSLIGG